MMDAANKPQNLGIIIPKITLTFHEMNECCLIKLLAAFL